MDQNEMHAAMDDTMNAELTWATLRGNQPLIDAIQRYQSYRNGSNKNPRVNSQLYDSTLYRHLKDRVALEMFKESNRIGKMNYD